MKNDHFSRKVTARNFSLNQNLSQIISRFCEILISNTAVQSITQDFSLNRKKKIELTSLSRN